MTSKKSPPEVSTTSEQANLLCTLPRTTLLSKPAMGRQQLQQHHTGYQPVVDLCTTSTPSMQVTVNPYSYGMLASSNNCDTDNESQYASVVYASSPQAPVRSTTNSRFNTRLASNTMSPGGRNQAYLSPQLARLNSTLRSNNGSPVHNRYHNSAMSSTTTLSTCLSPRSGRYEPALESYDQANHHVYCEIPMSSSKQLDRLRLQQQLRAKLRQQNNPSSLDNNETEFFEDSTQCDLHNISDLSDDEVNQLQSTTTFSELSFQQQHSNNCSPKHYSRRLNNTGSPLASSHNSRKSQSRKAHQHLLSPPPLKSRTTDPMSQLPATDV